MKRYLVRLLAVLSLATLLLPASAAAQYVRRIVRVRIPFEFTFEGRALPAGDYALVCVAPDRLELHDSRGQALASAVTRIEMSSEKSSSTALVFSTVNGEGALTAVQIENETTVYELTKGTTASVVALRSHRAAHSAGAGNK